MAVISLRGYVSNVVVGKILLVDQHPNADKLVVCKVDVGEETIQMVTGADYIVSGQLVSIALHGAKPPGVVVI